MDMRVSRRTAWRAAIGLVLSGTAAVSLAGCGSGPEPLSADQVVGTWRGDSGGRVTFFDDGRFEMSGIPRDAIVFSFSKPPAGEDSLTGAGTWRLQGEGRRSSSLELVTDTTGSFVNGEVAMSLELSEGGAHPVFYFETDVDEGYGYEVRRTSRTPEAR